MRKRTEIGLEKVLSTLKNALRCGKKSKVEHELIFFRLDYAKMLLVSAKQVLTELKAEVKKANDTSPTYL